MRTTVTLDDDIAKKISEHIKKTGKSAKEVFNDLLRSALLKKKTSPESQNFRLRLFKGQHGLMPGFSWDMSTADMLDKLDEAVEKQKP